MNKNVIVTGATSFIGYALIKQLYSQGYKITTIVRPNSKRLAILESYRDKIQIIKTGLGELDDVKLPFEKYDTLYHIGWESDFENARYNFDGQKKNIEYSVASIRMAERYGCHNWLGIGSQAECGKVMAPIDSKTVDNPQNAYAEVKCMTYDITKKMCHETGIRQFWPRLLSAYGPYDQAHTLVMSCIKACLFRQELNFTSAEQVWDFVYVDKVAEALMGIVDRGIPEKKYAIASGIGRPLRDYIMDISHIFNFPGLLHGLGKKEYSTDQPMYLVGDVDELVNDIGLSMKYDFTEGIKTITMSLKK